MAFGLAITLQFLRKTPNEAVIPLLVSALDSNYPPIRAGALEILVGRREPAGHEAVVQRAHHFDTAELTMLRRARHRMHKVLGRDVNSDDATTCDNAGRLILVLGEYELFPELIAAVERPDNRQASLAAVTLVRLAMMLSEESQAPPAGKRRRDPFFARRLALAALGRSLDRFAAHQRREFIDALLAIVPHDHQVLFRIVANPSHPCHRPLLEILETTPAVAAMRLLSESLRDQRTPQSLLESIARRSDSTFVGFLLSSLGSPVPLRVLRNMERLKQVAWLDQDKDVLLQLDGAAQASAVDLAKASSMPRSRVFLLLAEMLKHGQPAARRVACEALAEYHDATANELVGLAMRDPDPAVQAAASRQVRGRGLADAHRQLVALLESDRPELRQSAGLALGDFNFLRYVSQFAQMDDQKRSAIGEIVGRSDPTAVSQLRKELSSPSPTQRQRAIEMVQAMKLVTELGDELVARLEDVQELVATRVLAAESLSASSAAVGAHALEVALRDRNPSVREAAQHALATRGGARQPAGAGGLPRSDR